MMTYPTNSAPWIGPQIATNCGRSKKYFSTIAAHKISSPQPTTNAAILYRLNAAMTLADFGFAGFDPADGAVTGVGVAVMSPAGSTGTTAVLLGQGGQCLVVRGQFGIVGIFLVHGSDAEHDALARPLPIAAFGRPGLVGGRRGPVHGGVPGRGGDRVGVDLAEQFGQVTSGLLVILGLFDLLQLQEPDPHVDERGREGRPQQGVPEVLGGAVGFVGPAPLPPAQAQAGQGGREHQQVPGDPAGPQVATVHPLTVPLAPLDPGPVPGPVNPGFDAAPPPALSRRR